mmetsp:Transcript_1333/g.3653  ORF Transcript_1333/g.3653 Transcript_1333/m.3653 type:complete len:258 (-) Transcript_1333:36-809(-)
MISPWSSSTSPASMRSCVVFPQPFFPTRPTRSPVFTPQVTDLSTCLPPNDTPTSSNRTDVNFSPPVPNDCFWFCFVTTAFAFAFFTRPANVKFSTSSMKELNSSFASSSRSSILTLVSSSTSASPSVSSVDSKSLAAFAAAEFWSLTFSEELTRSSSLSESPNKAAIPFFCFFFLPFLPTFGPEPARAAANSSACKASSSAALRDVLSAFGAMAASGSMAFSLASSSITDAPFLPFFFFVFAPLVASPASAAASRST